MTGGHARSSVGQLGRKRGRQNREVLWKRGAEADTREGFLSRAARSALRSQTASDTRATARLLLLLRGLRSGTAPKRSHLFQNETSFCRQWRGRGSGRLSACRARLLWSCEGTAATPGGF